MPKINDKDIKKKRDLFLNSLDVTIPSNLDKYLTDIQRGILKCYMANCNFGEMCLGLKIKRSELISGLLDLGRLLNMYDLLENGLIPEGGNTGVDYLKGWMDSRTQLWRLINDQIKRR